MRLQALVTVIFLLLWTGIPNDRLQGRPFVPKWHASFTVTEIIFIIVRCIMIIMCKLNALTISTFAVSRPKHRIASSIYISVCERLA